MKKVVLVTGGSRGLGSAIVRLFAKNNYDVVFTYNSSKNEANKIKDEYKDNIYTIKCDVTNDNEIKKLMSFIEDKFGKLDCIINNAGIANDSEIFSKNTEDFIKVYETNLVGPFLVVKYAKHLLNHDSSIINISSTNGIDTYYPYSVDYDASKAALISLTHNLAVELAPIRVNAIASGWMNTEMIKDMDPRFKEQECKKILLHRFAEPVEIAKVVYFLASDDAKYINNTIIRVDGGKLD